MLRSVKPCKFKAENDIEMKNQLFFIFTDPEASLGQGRRRAEGQGQARRRRWHRSPVLGPEVTLKSTTA